jgi:hypothetical protein
VGDLFDFVLGVPALLWAVLAAPGFVLGVVAASTKGIVRFAALQAAIVVGILLFVLPYTIVVGGIATFLGAALGMVVVTLARRGTNALARRRAPTTVACVAPASTASPIPVARIAGVVATALLLLGLLFLSAWLQSVGARP